MILVFILLLYVFCEKYKKILIVLTNHDILGSTGRPTGWWLSEVAHPYDVFTKAGYSVDYVSPKGGKTPCDPLSVEIARNTSDQVSIDFFNNKKEFARTQESFEPFRLVIKPKYDAIFYAGGHGTMWDFPNSIGLQLLAGEIYKQGGVVSSVCHGPSGLVNLKVDGEYLIKGKKCTGFSNAEEEADHLTKVVPFSLEDALRKDGCEYSRASKLFGDYVQVDGRLVTGENPASAVSTAQAIISVLESL